MAKTRQNRIPKWSQITAAIASAVQEQIVPALGDIAHDTASEFQIRIKDQDFPGAEIPLSLSWVKLKQQLGLDPRILIATGDYVDSIQARRRTDDAPWRIGPDAAHALLARWLELGTRKSPARPHWDEAKRIAKDLLHDRGPRIIQRAKNSAVRALKRMLRDT